MIRLLTEADLDPIMAIEARSFPEGDRWTKEQWMDSYQAPYARLTVIEAPPQRIAGFCCLYRVLDEGEILHIAVDPAYRRKGFGEALLSDAVGECRRQGAVRMLLDVRAGNAAAAALYEKAGFGTIAVHKKMYAKPAEDGRLMELRL